MFKAKRVLALLLVVALLSVFMVACGDNKGNEKKDVTIGLVMKTLNNPYFLEIEKGAKKAADELGVTLDVKAAQEETSIEQQIAIVEDMIAKKYAAIAIAPSGSKEIVDVVKKALDAGIKVINIDNRIDPDAAAAAGIKVPYVGASNFDGGYMAGKYLAEQLGGAGKVAIIEGIQGVDNAEGRKNGAIKAFEEFPGIQLVASQSANWATEEALNVMTNILQANPDLSGVFCANDMMAFGAVQAIEAAGKNGIMVAGYDALEQALQYLDEGKMICTIDQRPDLVGYYGIAYCLDEINGKTVPEEYMVTLENRTSNATVAPPTGDITVGLVMKTLNNPYFLAIQAGAEKAANELGIKLDVKAAQEETSIEQQIAIVEDMIAKKYAAIAIAPSGSKEIVDVVKKALDAGIVVINIDNRIDPEAASAAGISVPYVGASNFDGGYMAGKYLAEQLGGAGKVAIIEGIQGVDNAEGRKNGAMKAFEEFSGIQLVASQSANWATEEALNVMTNILQANPDLNGVFCANDMMAFGAVQAIEAAGKTDQIKVAGYDALEQALAYIQEGKMIATIDQRPDLVGYQGVVFCLDKIGGKTVPDEYMVTLENITK